MYAIVRAGGRQEKVSVGDVLTVDKVSGDVGASITLEPIMLVDGDKVTSDPKDLGKTKITAEIVNNDFKGPKIHILKFKNKTGYRVRQGFRSKLTRVKVTKIA